MDVKTTRALLSNGRAGTSESKLLLATGVCQTVSHKTPPAGQGLFLSRTIGKGEVIGYYLHTLVYAAFAEDVQTKNALGKGCMAVTQESFIKSMLELKKVHPMHCTFKE